eukprot:14648828-Alexandrium_andersonii.AAC.1
MVPVWELLAPMTPESLVCTKAACPCKDCELATALPPAERQCTGRLGRSLVAPLAAMPPTT